MKTCDKILEPKFIKGWAMLNLCDSPVYPGETTCGLHLKMARIKTIMGDSLSGLLFLALKRIADGEENPQKIAREIITTVMTNPR